MLRRRRCRIKPTAPHPRRSYRVPSRAVPGERSNTPCRAGDRIRTGDIQLGKTRGWSFPHRKPSYFNSKHVPGFFVLSRPVPGEVTDVVTGVTGHHSPSHGRDPLYSVMVCSAPVEIVRTRRTGSLGSAVTYARDEGVRGIREHAGGSQAAMAFEEKLSASRHSRRLPRS